MGVDQKMMEDPMAQLPGYVRQPGATQSVRVMSQEHRREEQRRIVFYTQDRDWCRTQLLVLGNAVSNAIHGGSFDNIDRLVELAKQFHAVFGPLLGRDDSLTRNQRTDDVKDRIDAVLSMLESDEENADPHKIKGDVEMWALKFQHKGQVI